MPQKILLKSIPVISGDATHVDIELFYDKGGMNYFTGSSERRGLYVSVQPCKKQALNNTQFSSISFTAFSGVKQFVKEMNRFNQKTLNTFTVDSEIIDKLLNHVVAKNNLILDLVVS